MYSKLYYESCVEPAVCKHLKTSDSDVAGLSIIRKVTKQVWEGEDAETIGCNTGTGKPAVFPKRVIQVRVRCWILTHRRTPRTCAAVLRVFTGLL